MFPPLQYITQDHPTQDHSELAKQAILNGCMWVQIRMKNSTEKEVYEAVLKVIPFAKENKTTLIINDHVDIARMLNVDGVHLGENDMTLREARKKIGKEKIIGATANTFEDIVRVIEFADYIGLGPLRFTQTKKALKPIVGIEGYKNIIQKLRNKLPIPPIYAIGGIKCSDINDLHQIGLSGVAVSGLLMDFKSQKSIIEEIHAIFEKDYERST